MLAGSALLVVFVCADTLEARGLVREAMLPLNIIESPAVPVHIGYASTYSERAMRDETRSVAREHYTLSTAAAIFMASNSGFSETACAMAGAANTVTRCFLREGANWTPVRPGRNVFFLSKSSRPHLYNLCDWLQHDDRVTATFSRFA